MVQESEKKDNRSGEIRSRIYEKLVPNGDDTFSTHLNLNELIGSIIRTPSEGTTAEIMRSTGQIRNRLEATNPAFRSVGKLKNVANIDVTMAEQLIQAIDESGEELS